MAHQGVLPSAESAAYVRDQPHQERRHAERDVHAGPCHHRLRYARQHRELREASRREDPADGRRGEIREGQPHAFQAEDPEDRRRLAVLHPGGPGRGHCAVDPVAAGAGGPARAAGADRECPSRSSIRAGQPDGKILKHCFKVLIDGSTFLHILFMHKTRKACVFL